MCDSQARKEGKQKKHLEEKGSALEKPQEIRDIEGEDGDEGAGD